MAIGVIHKPPSRSAQNVPSVGLSPAHQRLIQLLAQAATDEIWEELERAGIASNTTGEAEGGSRDV